MRIEHTKPIKYKRWNKPYIYIPIITFVATMLVMHLTSVKLGESMSYSTICLTLAGFLFTAVSILLVLPSNEIMSILRKSTYFNDIQTTFFINIAVFIVMSVIFMFGIKNEIMFALLISNISETVYLTYCLSKLGKEIYKL
ncbi:MULTISPECIES: hypothetical protein [Peptostreptococcus]|uniref:hypothetical protein n=1 Tax=Peptostreptococcus TaxID=1257 RepID=UPI000338E6A9|nr:MULTISPECIES: hypothetical protein [Peptostreptococcus]MDK8278295.1 hypothetical protein [Peptostreptococcus anaerobius]MDU1264497.1 hypothetical protein [Peptostreptococcus sp.]MDU1598203.1 hypothetical protein [Peptostreptococcus anaerobius]MDU1681778.1 hypothetical protein [Peptostreptococcus anaerobius]CCY49969.1 unknown [Peptostreptococcus anaerobius CAG:621]